MAEKKKVIKKKTAMVKKTVKKKVAKKAVSKKTTPKKQAVKKTATVSVKAPAVKKEAKKKSGSKKLLRTLIFVGLVVVLFFLFQQQQINSQKMTVAKYYAHSEMIVINSQKNVFQKWLTIPNESAVAKLALYEDGSYDLGLLIFNKKQKSEPVIFSGKWWSSDKYTIKLRINNKDEATGDYYTFNNSRYITLTLNHKFKPVLMEWEGLLLERV